MRRRGGRGLGRSEAEIGVAGQLGGAVAGAVGQVAFGKSLEPPGQAADEPGLVPGRRGLAEQLGVAGL